MADSEKNSEKKYFWIKLKRDFFKRHDIRVIESMPNGKEYLLFYLKLLCESVDHEGALRFSETIPYNEDMLSTITNTNIDIVRSAIKLFTELDMMDILDDGTIFMQECQKMMGSETYWAERKRMQRQSQIGQCPTDVQPMSNVSNQCPSKSKILDKDKELDIEIDNNNTLLIHSNNINYEELAQELVNLWNSLKFEKKEELTDANYNVLVKACKHFGVENVVSAIQNYEKVLFSDYYFSHVWNLKDFLLSAKGLPNFLPEGETWKAYKKNHKGSILDGVKPAPKPKGESNPVVKGFLDSIV